MNGQLKTGKTGTHLSANTSPVQCSLSWGKFGVPFSKYSDPTNGRDLLFNNRYPSVNFINILRKHFSYKNALRSFSPVTF